MEKKYFNRELSWLDFNLRVLEEAQDESVPLLERLKFLAISASNLDEFFMVRVGGLRTVVETSPEKTEPSGLTVEQQLREISAATHRMMSQQSECFLNSLDPALAAAGIRRLGASQLDDSQASVVEHVFLEEIQSTLTPMAVGEHTRFPLLLGHTINVCVQLAPETSSDEPRFAIIPFGRLALRFVTLPSSKGGYHYILAEDVVTLFLQNFFPGEEIVSTAQFRIARNADVTAEDEAVDLVSEIEDVLDGRRESFCVRLEVSESASDEIRRFLQLSLEIGDDYTFDTNAPLDLAGFSRMAELHGFESLRYTDWPSFRSPDVDPARPILDQIREHDVLLHHPYHSFDPVVRFVDEAADDPDVVAIKQTLYRTSRRSPIINALIRASENGKQVTALIEIKARFDEARNIEWARRMEQYGVQVVYGVKNLKTHAKVCTVVRREPDGFQRYVHFSTGNYNEITARFYTDISYFTANEELAADAIASFNAICGYSQPRDFRKISIAPINLRRKLMEMIHVERERALVGQSAWIIAKLNSLVDPKIIDALYDASQAGVQVQLNVRGICCLRPGVKGLSENISVVSIVDRYLEHARILYFHHGGDERVFITSADWMPRNLDRRIEFLVPVDDQRCRQQLIQILTRCLSDNTKARTLQADGTWQRLKPGPDVMHAQADFHRLARENAQAAADARRTVFEPHQAPQSRP